MASAALGTLSAFSSAAKDVLRLIKMPRRKSQNMISSGEEYITVEGNQSCEGRFQKTCLAYLFDLFSIHLHRHIHSRVEQEPAQQEC